MSECIRALCVMRYTNRRILYFHTDDMMAQARKLVVNVRFTNADGSRGVGFLAAFVCLSVFFPHDISNTDGARITKLDKYSTMSPGNTFILGSKRSKSKVTKHKTVQAWVFALLFIYLFIYYYV